MIQGVYLATRLDADLSLSLDRGPVHAFNGTSAANYFATAQPGGEGGSTAGFAASVLLRVNSLSGGGTCFARMNTGVTSGWEILFASGSINGRWYDGGGVIRVSPTFAVSAGMLGKWLLATIWHENGRGHLSVQGVEVGDHVTFTGFTAQVNRTYLGRRQSSSSPLPTTIDVAGAATCAGILTANEVAAHYAAVKRSCRMQPLCGVAATPTLTVDLHDGSNGFLPNTLANRSNQSDPMTVFGTPTLVVDANPTFVQESPIATEVWVTLGDSEMNGSGLTAALPVGYPPATQDLWMLREGPNWRALIEPTADGGSPTPGPAGMFAWYRQQYVGGSKNVGVVLTASNGKRSDEWLPGAGNGLYERVRDRARAALSLPGATLKGFLSYDGANDAFFAASSTWLANKTAFFSALRSDLAGYAANAETVPVIYEQLCATAPASGAPGWAAVRADQAAFQASNRLMVTVPDSGPFSDDHVHLTTEGARLRALQYVAVSQALGI